MGVRKIFLIQLPAYNALYKIIVESTLHLGKEAFSQLFLSEFTQRIFSRRCHNMNIFRLRKNVC